MKKSIILAFLTFAGGVMSAQTAMPLNSIHKLPASQPITFSTANLGLQDESGDLKAAFTCLNAGEGEPTVIWSENFDDGAEGWTLTDAETFGWQMKTSSAGKAFTEIDPTDKQSLFIEGDYKVWNRGIAQAVTPSIDIPQNASLTAYVGYSYNLSESYCSLTIQISTDGGASWETLWNCLDEKEVKTWYWHKVNVNLTAYAGKTVKLMFEYGNTASYDNKGYMGDYYIDALQIVGAGEVTNVDVTTGEIVQFADASKGNPTSWYWQFPGGTPEMSTDQYPDVYYTKDGTYDVTLTVGDGTNRSSKTIAGYVTVTGTAPTAKIGLPATFRYSATRLPMVAPLAPVKFFDASAGSPTEWEWTFTGVDPDNTQYFTSNEETPQVGFAYQHQQAVLLTAKNSHGESSATETVSVEYEGFVNNLLPDDNLFTFSLDGESVFPGSNTWKITEYAEKFSAPSRPVWISGAEVYFTEATATEVIDQIAGVKVALCKSDNGLPGEQLDFASWDVFELDTPSAGGSLVGTAFEFSKPVLVTDEFFIVVSGIPEKSETCKVSFATAEFRDHGNTAYFLKKGEWISAADYFPAGKNHTSYAIYPYLFHSVMSAQSPEVIEVGKDAGEATFSLFSYCGYKTPVACDADWCRVTSEPNGLTLDEITIGYDALPARVNSRTATLTFTDGASEVNVTIKQERSNGVSVVASHSLAVSPSLTDDVVVVTLPSGTHRMEVVSLSGSVVECREGAEGSVVVDATSFAPGVYLIKVTSDRGVETAKFIKR